MDILGIGIGLPQILLILLVAMLVFGPDRLPEIARQIARGIKQLQNYASDVQGQFGDEIGGLRDEVLSIHRDLTSVQSNLRQGIGDLDTSLRTVSEEVHGTITTPIRSLPAALNGTTGTASAQPAALPEYAPPTPRPVQPIRPILRSVPAAEPELPDPDNRVPDYRPPA